MTSPSRRKPRTTRSSTAPARRFSAPAALILAAASLAAWPAWGDEPATPAPLTLELDGEVALQQPRNGEDEGEDVIEGLTREAMRLRKIHEILPYLDYEPDPDLARTDPCHNLCPRPQGCPPSPGERTPQCPEEAMWPFEVFLGRDFGPSLFPWEASNLFHRPLYFEDVALERYGHTHHHLVQPFVSVGRFGTQLVGLPYQMTIDPCWRRQYALGYHRPGDCVPKLHYLPPWDWNAALVQAGVVTGLVLILP